MRLIFQFNTTNTIHPTLANRYVCASYLKILTRFPSICEFPLWLTTKANYVYTVLLPSFPQALLSYFQLHIVWELKAMGYKMSSSLESFFAYPAESYQCKKLQHGICYLTRFHYLNFLAVVIHFHYSKNETCHWYTENYLSSSSFIKYTKYAQKFVML